MRLHHEIRQNHSTCTLYIHRGAPGVLFKCSIWPNGHHKGVVEPLENIMFWRNKCHYSRAILQIVHCCKDLRDKLHSLSGLPCHPTVMNLFIFHAHDNNDHHHPHDGHYDDDDDLINCVVCLVCHFTLEPRLF